MPLGRPKRTRPVGYNSSKGCPLFGTYRPWSATKIKSLYPTHAVYLGKVREWADRELRRGWLIRPDRNAVVRKARRFVDPWTGGCSDSCPAPLGR